jgi:hypothetical protein
MGGFYAALPAINGARVGEEIDTGGQTLFDQSLPYPGSRGLIREGAEDKADC